MHESKRVLNYWRQHARLLAEGLKERIEELSVSDYPATTPNEVISFLQDFLKEIGEEIDKTESEGLLRAFSLAVQQLAQSLDWLDNAHTGQTPRGLVQILKHLIEQMASGSRVVARPQTQYNYSIADLGYYFSRLVTDYIQESKQSKFTHHLSNPLKLISFPRIDRDNLLAHAIFGHELGHPVANEFLEAEEQTVLHKQKQNEVQRKMPSLVENILAGKNLDDDQKNDIQIKLFDNILQIRKRALEELISDAVGILIFGPSAFFAMYELLWHGSWDDLPTPNEWYPPSRLRMRLMLDLVDKQKIWDDLQVLVSNSDVTEYVNATMEFVSQARILASEDPSMTKLSSDPVLKIAYEWAMESLQDGIDFASTKTTSIHFKTDPSFSQLPELIQRLKMGVPPNEIGDPNNPMIVDFRASLIAAWMFKLYGISPQTGTTLSNREVDSLHMLTMRAIEYIFLQKDHAQ